MDYGAGEPITRSSIDYVSYIISSGASNLKVNFVAVSGDKSCNSK